MESHVRMLTSKEDIIGIYITMSGIKSLDRDLCIILSQEIVPIKSNEISSTQIQNRQKYSIESV